MILSLAAAALACPLTLPNDATAAAAGYRVLTTMNAPQPARIGRSFGKPWRDVQFSDGPPEEQAWLAPDEGGHSVQRWRFAPTGGRAIHMVCGYGPGSPILSRAVRARSCAVTVTGRGTSVAMLCR
jgi:hypothetical protein